MIKAMAGMSYAWFGHLVSLAWRSGWYKPGGNEWHEERMGWHPTRDDQPLWLHAASLGEVAVARAYAERMRCDLAIIDKRRTSGSSAVVYNIIGEVEGRDVLMIDDMIATAGTLCEAAKITRERGARSIRGAATHAVLAGSAVERLASAGLNEVAVTDTIPVSAEAQSQIENYTLLSVADILGEAIARIHKHQSVSSLFSHGVPTRSI